MGAGKTYLRSRHGPLGGSYLGLGRNHRGLSTRQPGRRSRQGVLGLSQVRLVVTVGLTGVVSKALLSVGVPHIPTNGFKAGTSYKTSPQVLLCVIVKVVAEVAS